MAISVLITVNSVQYNATNDVLKDSLKLSYSLFRELEPTTNKVEFKLSRSSTLLPLILATVNDVIVEVKEGSTYLFRGYLTDNYSWQITNRGQQPVSISAEDPGIKLLKKNWVSTNALYTLYSNLKICDKADQTNSIIHKIASLAGVSVSTAIPTITSTLSLNIQDKDNTAYWDVLKQIAFEYGYVFYFENDGEFNLYPIAKSSITPATTFSTTTNIIAETDNKGIEIQKKLIPYKQINLTWDEWETKTDVYVFRDSTGGNNTYDCNIPLAPGAYYPTGADASTFVFSDYKAETGQDIINVSTATLDYVVDAGITVEFENLGTRGKIRIRNTSGSTADIRKLKVKANSVILKKNTNVIKAGTNSTPIYKYTAKYIHDLATANAFANTLKDFYAYSNYTYSFKSKLNVDVGIIATLHDSMWATVNEPVLITNKEVKENGVISYTAVGIDIFDLFAVTARDITIPGDINNTTIYNPQILNPTITIGTTTVGLGGTTTTIGGVNVTGTVSGNAETASKLLNGRTIGISGKIAGTATLFDGSSNVTINTTSAAITSAEVTDATSNNTVDKIVKRDGYGNFSANSITVSNLVTTTDIVNKTQKLYAHFIPGSEYEILTHKNVNTNDPFTIFEIRSPDSAVAESTLSQHNVVSGTDDWVRDISFHNYGSTMKAVDVISHFTGTDAGRWEWVTRYTDGTDYSMVERDLLSLDGETGNLRLGEDDSLTSTARAKIDVRNKGYTSTPTAMFSVDSSHGTQPTAITASNGNNSAMASDLVKFKLLNAADSGTVLKLENAGTGNYLVADGVFSLSKQGNITTTGNVSIGGNLTVTGTTNIGVTWTNVSSKPTTLSGYGITDAASSSHAHTFVSLTSKPTTLLGYGITDAASSNHSHAFSTITSSPTTLAGYGITDAASSSHAHTFVSLTSKPTTLLGYGITDGALSTHTHTDLTNATSTNTVSTIVKRDSSGNFSAAAISATSVSTTGNVSVGGNLTVTGTMTYNQVNEISTTSPTITIGESITEDNKDRGIRYNWNNGSTVKIGFFGLDDSTGSFTFIPDATNTSDIYSGTKGTIDAYIDWSNVSSKPTTLSGYGITDGASSNHSHTFTSLTSKPTTLGGYGITDAASSSHSHAFSSLSSIPTTLSGYGITDGATSTHNHDATYSVLAHTHTFASLTSKPTTLSGYGITDSVVLTTGSYSDPAWLTISKTKVGLSAVENTALSTWAGSANITTLGTVSSGTWSGSTIGVTKGGTGTATQFTAGSVLYAGAGGVYDQNNSKFFWNVNTAALGLGTGNPSARLHLYSASAAPYIRIQGSGDGDNYSGFELWSNDATPRKWQFVHKQTSYSFALTHYNGTAWISPFLIDTTGKVGINDATLTDALNVNGNVKATSFIGSLGGNASTASILQTARTIAGVSFDGSTNISIPFANLSTKPTTLAGYGITDAALSTIVPVGTILMWAAASAPSGYLLCYGQAVSRTTYASLAAVLKDAGGTDTWVYGSGDGSTTFNMPNFEEAAPVGVGSRESGIVDHDTYTIGEFKDDQEQGHYHYAVLSNGENIGISTLTTNVGTAQGLRRNGTGTAQAREMYSDGTNGTPRKGTTTRGKRYGVSFIIKY